MSAERFFCPYVSKTFICNSATPLSVSETKSYLLKLWGESSKYPHTKGNL